MQISDVGKKKYSETKRLIRNAQQEHQLVLFVGSGASVDAGMPLWTPAVDQIAEKLNIDDSNLDNLIVPQYYYNARGRKEYTQLMREIFHYNDKLYPQKVHKLIMEFDTATIITTNYDHLIEQAAEDNGEFLQVISQDSDLPYRKAGKELVKMHGDFEHDNFVLKEDDYLHYHKNFKLIENYVKSLIGSKTVLFIGYSLSDPDVRHIFTWVKEILDEHFQRAYLIVTGREADQNEIEYFRHLGVNIIYATELFENLESNDHSNQLVQTLEYILDDEEKDKSVVESLYYSLKPFASLGYTYKKYIERAFWKLQRKINEHITLKIDADDYIEYSSDHAIEEDKKLLEDLDLAIDGKSKDPQMKTIAEVLRKSAIKGTSRLVKDGNRLRNERKEFSDQDDNPAWIEAIYNFNYPKLIQIKESNSRILSESKPELYIQQAYICEFLGDYLSAYFCLDNAATYFYRKREYAWYFISVWNKRNVAQIISFDIFYNMGIEPEILSSIKSEYNAIDLDKTLQSIPDLGNDYNQFLRDLKDFKFSSDLFYDVFTNSTKASAQAEETYFMFAGLPAYEQMRKQVYDYYRYGVCNCLMVDRYRENNEIYNLFVRSLLASAAAPDKEISSDESIFGSSGNIHVDSIFAADIHLVLRHIEASKLRKLFHQFNINIVEVSEDGMEYLRNIPGNVAEVFDHNLYAGRDLFWRFLCLVSHIKMDSELVESIIKVILDLKETEIGINRRESLLEFANALYEQKLYEDEDLCKQVSKLATRLIQIIAKDPEQLSFYRNSIVAFIAFCERGGCLYDEEEHIKLILTEPYHALLPSIYTGSSDRIKALIGSVFKDWDCPDNAAGYIIYAKLVLADIIDSNKEIEEKAFGFVLNHHEKKQSELKKGIRSASENDSVENYLVNLYLTGKIEDEEKLRDVVSKGSDNLSKWLIDIEGYDYSKFELNWLKHCYSSLLTKLSENNKVREEVRRIYKERYPSEYIDNKTNEIIVKYFM